MKLLRESIDCEICLPTEKEIAEFVANHLPSEECVRTKILEINPNFDYKENIYFKIKDRIESVIRSTMEDYSCEEADAISYIDIVFDDIKAHTFNDPELEGIYNIKEPVEVVEEPAVEVEVVEDHPLEEAVQVQYFRITYKHETGIYVTDAVEASTYDEAVKIFNERGRGELISCDPISKEEYDEIIKGLGTENLTEDLNVNVDTEEQNINVAAEENAAVEVKVAPKDCVGVECDAEAELAELAKDPKYAKAFAYLMNTLQGEEVEDQPEDQPEEKAPVEEAPIEEPITESVEEPAKEPVEEKDTEEKDTEEKDAEEEDSEEEDSEEEDTEEVSDEIPEGPSGIYVANTLNELAVGEYDTINAYNDFLLTVQGMVTKPEGMPEEEEFKPSFCPELAEQINEVIKDILAEENKHVGQLQELLKRVSPNAEHIEAGVDEAKEQMEEVEVND